MSKANLPQYDYDNIIVGGGPAGYTAGIYAARSGLKTLLVEGAATVSQITITDLIENYPGIPDGINGFDLMQLFKKQAQNFGLEIIADDVQSIKKAGDASAIWNIAVGDKLYKTLSVIAATGAQWNKLGVPGEEEFAGKGVSYCATCDGPFYRNKDVIVVGGGDTAIQEALFLTHFAKKVTVIHRRDRLRAAAILQKKAFAEKKIEFVWKAKLTEVTGAEFVTGIRVADVETGKVNNIEAEGVFIFVGRTPNTGLFMDMVNLDKGGYIVTDDNMRTSAPGIFAAGDCRAKQFRQVVTAAGDGANAIYSAELYVDEIKGQTY
ncbi:thioredoxin reductase [hydrocarbon metagenome]|uniref:Thioredoxin reductase n=1 Tax=hydrocarbon metagenome TaxID=938273 RepID=A0A0W8FPK6_9ZZZZ